MKKAHKVITCSICKKETTNFIVRFWKDYRFYICNNTECINKANLRIIEEISNYKK